MQQPNATIQTISNINQEHAFYVLNEIESPAEYLDMYDVLRTATANDTVKIYLNTIGGRVDSAIQMVNAIRNTNAKVVGVLTGACHSAGTYIFLACDEWEVNSNCLMLIHNYSGGGYGKGKDLVEQVLSNDRWVTEAMKALYKGFLSEEEIDQVIKNQDIWLHSDEILERLSNVVALREEEHNQYQEELKETAIQKLEELKEPLPNAE